MKKSKVTTTILIAVIVSTLALVTGPASARTYGTRQIAPSSPH